MSGPPLLKSLPELVERGFISAEQAERIRTQYTPSAAQRTDRSLLLFSLLGGLLIGTGVVLLVAHNWDGFPRGVRTVLAFVPLALAQALCLFALLKRPGRAGWMEATALGLAFAVAACMSLVAQVYHISDRLSDFFLAWSLLIIGLVYVQRSFATALLYLVLITSYAVDVRLGGSGAGRWSSFPWAYWGLLALVLPFSLRHLRERPAGVSGFWLACFVAISFAIGSQLFWHDYGPWQSLGPAALAMAYVLVPVLAPAGARVSAFTGIGRSVLLYLFYVIGSPWARWDGSDRGEALGPDLIPLALMVLVGLLAYAVAWRRRSWRDDPMPELFFVYAALVLLGMASPMAMRLLANVVLFAVGVAFVRQGIASGSLGRMNLGLLVLAAVVVSRFFDMDSMIVKGLLAIAIGSAFLLLNLRLLRARKAFGDA